MKGFRDVIVLCLIATVSGVCLSVVYKGTKDIIEEAQARELEDALQNVAAFLTDERKEISFEHNGKTFDFYVPEDNPKTGGAAVRVTTSEGYSGDITFLMGVDSGGAVSGFQILESKETPGLGSKASDKSFWGQFIGNSLETYQFAVKSDGGEVDAITASTITSRAIAEALDNGLQAYQAYRGAP
jgi:Na+-translocating ferredoxin:NAD+ oxidoreductase subunit G